MIIAPLPHEIKWLSVININSYLYLLKALPTISQLVTIVPGYLQRNKGMFEYIY